MNSFINLHLLKYFRMKDPKEKSFRFYDIPVSFQRDNSSEAEELVIKMSKARGLLHFDLPFFGFLLTQLEIFPVKGEPSIGSFAMDTRRIYVNKDFFKRMEPKKLRGVLLHAIIHLIMKHGERGLGKNKEIWGISCDVNAHKMVKDTLYDQNLVVNKDKSKYDFENLDDLPTNLQNLSAEEINSQLYSFANNHLKSEDQNISPANKKFGDKILKDVLDYVGTGLPCNYIENYEEMEGSLSKSHKQAESDRFMGMIKYAYDQAKRQGKIPGNLKDYINELLNPRIPWFTYLEQYIQKSIISDYRWVPPNRRFIHEGIILPSTKRENIDVIIALDTSGSISNEELQLFLSESLAIFNSFGNIRLTVIQCDYSIQHVVNIEAGESIDGKELPWDSKKVYGRGGTSFIPVFEYIEEKNLTSSVLLYFTDGYGSFPSNPPEYDVIWVMTTMVKPPFGYVIEYDPNDIIS